MNRTARDTRAHTTGRWGDSQNTDIDVLEEHEEQSREAQRMETSSQVESGPATTSKTTTSGTLVGLTGQASPVGLHGTGGIGTSVFSAIQASVATLNEDQAAPELELAIFPGDVTTLQPVVSDPG